MTSPVTHIAKLLIRSAVLCVSVCSVLSLILVGLLPHTGLYRTMTVLSGRMRPTFLPGDLVVTTRKPITDVQKGDVLVYAIPVGDRHVESHRIVQIISRSPQLVVKTRGDANASADPWTAELSGSSVWIVRATVPFAGWPILWLRSPLIHKLTIFITPSIVALLLLRAIWRRPEPVGSLLDQ
jgi:signal peptidase